jgi:hypothetical protein
MRVADTASLTRAIACAAVGRPMPRVAAKANRSP